jgi:hypothetical protein
MSLGWSHEPPPPIDDEFLPLKPKPFAGASYGTLN